MNPLPYLDGGQQETEYERDSKRHREGGERNGLCICICNGAIFLSLYFQKGF
jgi:hypothetical protein